jgi:hypothetical protein
MFRERKEKTIRKKERREKVLTHPFLSRKINLDVNEFVLEREDQ